MNEEDRASSNVSKIINDTKIYSIRDLAIKIKIHRGTKIPVESINNKSHQISRCKTGHIAWVVVGKEMVKHIFIEGAKLQNPDFRTFPVSPKGGVERKKSIEEILKKL